MSFVDQLRLGLVTTLIGGKDYSEVMGKTSRLFAAVNTAFANVDYNQASEVEKATSTLCASVQKIFESDRAESVRNCVNRVVSSFSETGRQARPQKKRQGKLSRAIGWLSSIAGTICK